MLSKIGVMFAGAAVPEPAKPIVAGEKMPAWQILTGRLRAEVERLRRASRLALLDAAVVILACSTAFVFANELVSRPDSDDWQDYVLQRLHRELMTVEIKRAEVAGMSKELDQLEQDLRAEAQGPEVAVEHYANRPTSLRYQVRHMQATREYDSRRVEAVRACSPGVFRRFTPTS